MNRYARELTILLALVLMLGAIALIAPAFFDRQPLMSRLARESPALIVACGTALIIVARQIDISVGSQFGVCSVCTGLLAAAGCPLPVCAMASIALGALLGAFNGLLVAGLQLPSIVVTLGTMVIWRDSLRLLQQGQFINLPVGFPWFGLPLEAGQWLQITLGLGVFGAITWASTQLNAGRFIYAVGSDAEAARLAGIAPRWTTWSVFVINGALTGLAALLNALQSPQVDPKAGTGLELKAIAAAVVGGIAVTGGRGRLWSVLVGLLLLTTISPALTYLHVQAYWEKAIQGAIILLAVVADSFRTRRT